MYGLDFERDVRHTQPNVTHHRAVRFRVGWQQAVEGRVYSDDTLKQLTWHNLGYRLGKLFGETSPEMVNKMYDWCVRQQQGR